MYNIKIQLEITFSSILLCHAIISYMLTSTNEWPCFGFQHNHQLRTSYGLEMSIKNPIVASSSRTFFERMLETDILYLSA